MKPLPGCARCSGHRHSDGEALGGQIEKVVAYRTVFSFCFLDTCLGQHLIREENKKEVYTFDRRTPLLLIL